LAILERDDPCDLMIADLVMTGLTGVVTVRLARRTRPDLKVLFCGGYADMSRFEEDIGNEHCSRSRTGQIPWPKQFIPLSSGRLRVRLTTSCSCGRPKVKVGEKLSTKRHRNKPEKSARSLCRLSVK
jgi:hypothetical protein